MFRPCIDLHEGRVKQIVGGSLTDDPSTLQTHFVSERSAGWYAALYRKDALSGGHVIQLGPRNEAAAREALAAYPGGFHLGGGVNIENAQRWLDAGASHVIVTSWVFRDGRLDWDRLRALSGAIGPRRLVLDLSCRKRGNAYWIVTDRWQKFTIEQISPELLGRLSQYCDEFLVHAADVEGLCQGIDGKLVENLADWASCRTTYAGGAKSLEDLETVTRLSQGRIDLTIGAALDIFGGTGVCYEEAVEFNRRTAATLARSPFKNP